MHRSSSSNIVFDTKVKSSLSSSPSLPSLILRQNSLTPSPSSSESDLLLDNDLPSLHPNSYLAMRKKSRIRFAQSSVHVIPFLLFFCGLVLWFFSKPGQMARLPFGRNPFAEAEPTPSMIANQSRPAPSTIQNLSRPPPPPPRDMAEKNDRNRKRDFGDNSKANPGKKLKNAMIDNSSTDLVVSTFGSLAAENFSEDEVKLLNNRSDEEAELSFRSGLGDAFYHGLRVLAQKNSIIKDQERSLKKLRGEASSHTTKMAEAQKKLDGEIRARKDDVDRLQLTLDKANFDLDNLKRTHEDEVAKLRSENELLLASTRKGQSEAYNAGFLDYLRNFLAADPDYNWSTHFAPSTPGYMLKFQDDNADLITAAKEELRLKIEAEKKAIAEAEASKKEIAGGVATSPSQTIGT